MSGPGTELREACEKRLRALLPEDEAVIAVGTAETRRNLEGDISTAGRWTFLVVTGHRLVHADWGHGENAPHEEIVFDDVARWADGEQYHRYAVTIEYPPVARLERSPGHHFLWFRWGRKVVEHSRGETNLVFSHRDTAAAKTLRNRLESHERPHGSLELEERTRAERTEGSRFELFPRK